MTTSTEARALATWREVWLPELEDVEMLRVFVWDQPVTTVVKLEPGDRGWRVMLRPDFDAGDVRWALEQMAARPASDG